MDLADKKTPQRLTIRPARPADYDEIVAVWREVGLNAKLQGRDARDAYCRQLARFPDLYLVTTDGARLIGVIFGSHDERKGWINRLAVLPEYQGRGVATDLAEACDQAIREQGIGIVAALIEPPNPASARVFEKLGYLADVPVMYYRKLDDPTV